MTEYTVNDENHHVFWNKKPVTPLNKIVSQTGEIRNIKDIKLYNSPEPINIPLLTWESVDLEDTGKLQQVCEFLNKYYTRDNSYKFKYIFTKDIFTLFIQNGECIVLKFNDIILGTVSYNMQTIVVNDKTEKFCHVNFLCVHPTYRNNDNKKMVHLLIDEITRRSVNKGYSYGIFSTDKLVPKPISVIRYYNRPLNYNKLEKHKFIILDKDGKCDKLHNRFIENVKPSDYYKKITIEDINNNEQYLDKIYELYSEYMLRFNMYIKYSKEDLINILFNNNVNVYILKNKNEEIVDFISYYKISKSIKDSDEQLNIANLFLYSCLSEDIQLLISNLIRIVSNNDDIDLLTISDNMQNSEAILSALTDCNIESDEDDYDKVYDYKFGKAPIKSYINFFNWQSPLMKANQICFNII